MKLKHWENLCTKITTNSTDVGNQLVLWWKQTTCVRKHGIFSEEDRILIKNLYELKGCGTKRLTNEFPTKGWKLQALNKLLRKMKNTGTQAS